MSPTGPVTELRSFRFDIYSFGFEANEIEKVEDEKGMLETSSALNKLITAEVDAGIDASRIVLGGFSQGGASARRDFADMCGF